MKKNQLVETAYKVLFFFLPIEISQLLLINWMG